AFPLELRVLRAGQPHHRDVGALLVAFLPRPELPARGPRHLEVEEHDARPLLLVQAFQRLLAVAGLGNDVAVEPEEFGDSAAGVLVVVHHEHPVLMLPAAHELATKPPSGHDGAAGGSDGPPRPFCTNEGALLTA